MSLRPDFRVVRRADRRGCGQLPRAARGRLGPENVEA